MSHVHITLYPFVVHDTAVLPNVSGDSGCVVCSLDAVHQTILSVLQTQEKHQGEDGGEEAVCGYSV